MFKFGDAVRYKQKGRKTDSFDSHINILCNSDLISKQNDMKMENKWIESYYFNENWWFYYSSIRDQKFYKYFQGSQPDVEGNMSTMSIGYMQKSVQIKSINIE